MTTVAIDFGTSNTVISILETDTQQPKSLRFPNLSRVFVGVSSEGERLEFPVIPSLLFIKSPDNIIDPHMLSEIDLIIIKKAVSIIEDFQNKVKLDFKGTLAG